MAEGNDNNKNQCERLVGLLHVYSNPLMLNPIFPVNEREQVDYDTHKKFTELYRDLENKLYSFKRLQWQRFHLEVSLKYKIVLRGLRVLNMPTYGETYPELLQKWQNLNLQLSYDYMHLLIEFFKPQEKELADEINRLQEQLINNFPIEVLGSKLDELADNIQGYDKRLQNTKTKKLQKDLNDFQCEAKHLLAYTGTTRTRDSFCTVNLDQEEVYRTKVVEKSLSPFYGEDYYFEIPRHFQCLAFYIYDKGVFQSIPIGKVAIMKEDLYKYNGKETWFSLQPVDSNSEVQGKVHLDLKLHEVITDNGSVQQLVVRIIECQGLPLINGQSCDPYATVSLVGPSRSDQKKTKVKKKTSNPHFDETFYFEVTRSSSYTRKSQFQVEEEDIEKLEIRVDLWNNINLVQDNFLGEIKVPVKILKNDSAFQAWYYLQPKDNVHKSSRPEDLGSLRLNICYSEDYVLSSQHYTPLRDLLLKSPEVKPISASAGHILGEACRENNDAMLPFVRLLLHHNKLVPFVTAVAELELRDTQEANTIFRGNSMATRCIDEMMKIVGKHYLKVTLKSIIDEICENSKPCEIDPIRLKEGDNLETNKENLRQYVDKIFHTIVDSSMSCPTLMCDVFYSLRQMSSKRFPNDLHVQYSAVSSFVFLRFFAVAVVSPHSFHLRPHHPDAQTSRTLTLISKTIQTLGSWGSLSKNKLSSFKESFMCDFFKLFQEDQCTELVKKSDRT
ncbi:ras GTPase-activating protein 2-like [Protopterus annectens]|uniref:ras GTPase-activating protein 2-like n=1 Tax=Protopterus annectens TaxID=7888 RepID=UPI001CFB9E3E|nr:ras GTPase-activating protein 2-like [Protopterus annectens]